MEDNFTKLAYNVKAASKKMAVLPSEVKNQALKNIAENISANKDKIVEANRQDLENARTLVENGEITPSTFNRLKLDENKMRDMIQGVNDIARLDDPIGKVLLKRELDEGLVLTKTSCPIGVLGIIFEARPDVITQVSALAIKSSNEHSSLVILL